MHVRRLSFLCMLLTLLNTGVIFDIACAIGSCQDVGQCPLPNGLTISGLDNGATTPWPPINDGTTKEPCLPTGKKYMKFKCNEDFRLKTDEIELSCNEMYTWNLKAPTCVPKVPKPPPPPQECTGGDCIEETSFSDYSSSETGGVFSSNSADDALLMVIIVLSVLLVISWLIFLIVFVCKRGAGHIVHETVYVHNEPRQKSFKNLLRISTRPPMPKPREQTTLEYDYVQRNGLTGMRGDDNSSGYLEPMRL